MDLKSPCELNSTSGIEMKVLGFKASEQLPPGEAMILISSNEKSMVGRS